MKRSFLRPNALVALGYLFVAHIGFPSVCLAAPYEVTVYSDDIPEKGEAEAELILSVAKARPEDDGPKSRVAQGLAEYSFGIADGWAVGIELPVARADGISKLKGLKAEVQYVHPHDPSSGWYWGVRSDIGYESSVYEARGGNSIDINPVIGYRYSVWHLVINPSVEIPLSGDSSKTIFKPSGEVVADVGGSNAVGLQYFGDMGPLSKILPRSHRDEMLYLVWKKKLGTRRFSVGLGQPFAATSGNVDKWVAKAAISLELE